MSRRRYALKALEDIIEHDAYANLCLKDSLRELPREDADWISALVYTVLDHLYLIDFYIMQTARGRLQPAIRNILRMGFCQILFMRTPLSAACNESVKLAKEIGKPALAGYVNGVMRSFGRMAEIDSLPQLPDDPVQKLSLLYSFPEYLINEYISHYDYSFTESLLSYKHHGTTIRVQPPYSNAELEACLCSENIPFARGKLVDDAFHMEKGFSAVKNDLFLQGKVTIQSESAMLVCRALSAKPGDRVLDACSAPGGKAAYISALTGGHSDIFAWELHPHRLDLIKATMERLRVDNVRAECRDACAYDDSLSGRMDAVLLDVPCSGLGLPGKPDIRYKKMEQTIVSLIKLQRSILDCCCKYVRPGGTLLYSTCTISRRENEDQISSFLNKHPEFKLLTLAPYLPPSFAERASGGMLQLFPHLDGTEGFFIAKMEKRL